MPPKVEKHHIIDIVKAGKVFTFKATRHIIPARPLGVDIPLSPLKDQDISVENANRKLSELLKAKVLRRFSPGQIWWGRRYDGALYVFEDRSGSLFTTLGSNPSSANLFLISWGFRPSFSNLAAIEIMHSMGSHGYTIQASVSAA